jgi:hypothetical protein
MVLTAAQMAAIATICRPLEPWQADALLADLAGLIGGGSVGDGQLYRWLRELQAIFCDFPGDREAGYDRESYTEVARDFRARTARRTALRAAGQAIAAGDGNRDLGDD